MSKYIPSGKTYDIESVQDMCNVVTKENLELFLEDLRSVFETVLKFREAAQQVGVEAPELHKFEWIDDGKHDHTNQFILTDSKP